MNLIGSYKNIWSHTKGFTTKEQLVVIESDDWGSERIPNKEAQNNLMVAGIQIKQNPHTMLDTLENGNDFYALVDLFNKPKFKPHKPVITCNWIMANPDYEKIDNSNFEQYYFEPFSKTYFNKYGNNELLSMVKDTMNQGHIFPQFHGREHIQFIHWLAMLRQKHSQLITAFKQKCFGVDLNDLGYRKNLTAAFEYKNKFELNQISDSISEGLDLFNQIFGFKSTTAIAPRYVFDSAIEKVLKQNGIEGIQSALNQLKPIKLGYRNIYHYTGEINSLKQTYTVRNAFFEPSYSNSINWVQQVLKKAQMAFWFNKPLIISMHRINFVGGLSETNRTQNLKQLEELLTQLIIKYPKIQFINSDQLLKKISDSYVRN